MRLLYLCLSPAFGMHQYTADLANRALSEHEVHLVASQNYPADRYSPQITVHTPMNLTSTGLSVSNISKANLRAVHQVITSIKPTAVHFTAPHIWNPYLLRWLRSRQIPTIHTIHDLIAHPRSRYGLLLGTWNRLILRYATFIVVHNAGYKQILLDWGVDRERIVTTPLLHLFLGYESAQRLDQSGLDVLYEPFALFFGRVEHYKGVEHLLKAITLLSEQQKWGPTEQDRLVIAGEGKLPRHWNRYLPIGVQRLSRFISDSEGIDLFRRCSVIVLPYVGATQSALIAAAYYFRKPVIASGSGALAEYIEPGVTGYIVRPEDPIELANALGKVYSSNGEIVRMGLEGRRWYDRERQREERLLRQLYRRYP